jgi:hypothetical protein
LESAGINEPKDEVVQVIVCGVSVAASEATLLWVDSESLQPIGGAKVELNDGYNRTDVLQTLELLRQLMAERKTEKILIRKSSTSGKFSAGHMSFRIEALLTVAAPCAISFLSAQGVVAHMKRTPHVMPDSLKKYQWDAYNAVIAGLA